MNFPKLMIVSDGRYTGALLDGVFIGQGIKRLDFSTEQKDGEMESVIHIMDLDVGRAKLLGVDDFEKFIEGLAKKEQPLP